MAVDYDALTLAEMAELASQDPDWNAWQLEHPEMAAEVEIARRVRALIAELRAADLQVSPEFQARLMARVLADHTLLYIMDFGLAAFGRVLIELLNALLGITPRAQPEAA